MELILRLTYRADPSRFGLNRLKWLAGPPEGPKLYRQVHLGATSVRVLDIAYQTQRPHVMYCAVASLKMAYDFLRVQAGGASLGAVAPELSMDEIAAQTRTDPLTGVVLSDEFFASFNKIQRLVKVEWAEGVTLEQMSTMSSNGLPAIPAYYPSVCVTGDLEVSGASHLGVYLGHSDDEVLLQNPWYGEYHKWPRKAFEQSRELLGRQAIVFKPIKEKTLDSLLEGGRSA